MPRLASERQSAILKIIKETDVGRQAELAELLQSKGYEATQSSVSRDLPALNIVKVDGIYRVPKIAAGESALVEALDIEVCGANLLVLRTGPGTANLVAYTIDRVRPTGVLGTIAGDDTVFVAVEPKRQSHVIEQIVALFVES